MNVAIDAKEPMIDILKHTIRFIAQHDPRGALKAEAIIELLKLNPSEAAEAFNSIDTSFERTRLEESVLEFASNSDLFPAGSDPVELVERALSTNQPMLETLKSLFTLAASMPQIDSEFLEYSLYRLQHKYFTQTEEKQILQDHYNAVMQPKLVSNHLMGWYSQYGDSNSDSIRTIIETAYADRGYAGAVLALLNSLSEEKRTQIWHSTYSLKSLVQSPSGDLFEGFTHEHLLELADLLHSSTSSHDVDSIEAYHARLEHGFTALFHFYAFPQLRNENDQLTLTELELARLWAIHILENSFGGVTAKKIEAVFVLSGLSDPSFVHVINEVISLNSQELDFVQLLNRIGLGQHQALLLDTYRTQLSTLSHSEAMISAIKSLPQPVQPSVSSIDLHGIAFALNISPLEHEKFLVDLEEALFGG